MLIVETPKQVTQAVKEQKKDKQAQSGTDNEDNKPKKAASKTAVAQVDTPAATETVAKTEDTAPVETKLDLAAIQPQVMQAVADTLAAKTTVVMPSMVVSSTVNTGWATDGVNATLYLDSNGNIIQYNTKANASLTVEVTNSEGTKSYPLNYGDKLNVKITQKK